jgi:hypothetical protein
MAAPPPAQCPCHAARSRAGAPQPPSRGRLLDLRRTTAGKRAGSRLGPPLLPRQPMPPWRPPGPQPRSLALLWFQLPLGKARRTSAQVAPATPSLSDPPGRQGVTSINTRRWSAAQSPHPGGPQPQPRAVGRSAPRPPSVHPSAGLTPAPPPRAAAQAHHTRPGEEPSRRRSRDASTLLRAEGLRHALGRQRRRSSCHCLGGLQANQRSAYCPSLAPPAPGPRPGRVKRAALTHLPGHLTARAASGRATRQAPGDQQAPGEGAAALRP